ncbi:MAG TPA: FUSC family membrane protein, partial [Streptosporangiaceae bacterium]
MSAGWGLLRELTRLRRSRLALAAALPSAVGYAIPLVAGLATGHVADGLTGSAGALIVGFANLGGPYRVRSRTLLAATAAAGLAALVGGLAGPDTAATIVAMSGWGFAGGLLIALGTRAAFVGLLSTWALLLASDLALHGAAVLREALLITAGGAVQTVIAIAAWPLRPFAAERHAVADAYRALASYARIPGTATLHRATEALVTAAEMVDAGAAPGAPRGLLRALAEQGEWVRVELTALARGDAPGSGPARQAAAQALDVIASGGDLTPAVAGLRSSVQGIGDPAARRQAENLTTWITAAGRRSHRGAPGPVSRPRPLRSLRAELTWNSSVFRHAARLSAALVVAGIVYRGLSLG